MITSPFLVSSRHEDHHKDVVATLTFMIVFRWRFRPRVSAALAYFRNDLSLSARIADQASNFPDRPAKFIDFGP